MEEDETDGQYDQCPLCGINWEKHSDNECEEKQLIHNKPEFNIRCLDTLKESYLKEIIIWQDRRIQYLEKQER